MKAYLIHRLFLTISIRAASCLLSTRTSNVQHVSNRFLDPRGELQRFASSKKASVLQETDATDTNMPFFPNPSITAQKPREFKWWSTICDEVINQLEKSGGERFIPFSDDRSTEKREPDRLSQFELRYIEKDQVLAGIIRFGLDCQDPRGFVHGGELASFADEITATLAFKASDQWGMTTRFDCRCCKNMAANTPFKVEVKVAEFKKRKVTIDWCISSMTLWDKKGQNRLKYALGSADFLLPRQSIDSKNQISEPCP